MRIATWNINGLRARLDFLRLWLEARKPDVLGLQELKITDAEFPTDFFTDLGYHVVTHGQKAWNGVAVVSRSPAEVLDRGLAGQEAFGARLLRVKVDGLDFTTVYCPNGKDLAHEDFPKKLAWFDSLLNYWAAQDRTAQAVLCGDFNVVPAALDSWLGGDTSDHIFHTPAERERFDALLRLGLFDLFRQRYPDRQEFSWWDYRGGAFHRRHGLRIDLLLGTAATRERVTEVEIDREFRKKQDDLTPSDHAPVFADLN
ncbi:MAG: exodeoxyribonuclease III [Proteobacteria bacterium]|nr:exodeoxyribonuclease III [Pseudomonadota bacterium]